MRKLRADTNVQKAVLDRGVQTRAQARSDELMKKEVGGAHKGMFVISSRRNCKRDNLGNSRSARLIPRSKFVRTTTIQGSHRSIRLLSRLKFHSYEMNPKACNRPRLLSRPNEIANEVFQRGHSSTRSIFLPNPIRMRNKMSCFSF